jgi:hypothetical protein
MPREAILNHPLLPPAGAKAAKCKGRPVPQLKDVTAKTGITFKHTSDQAGPALQEKRVLRGLLVADLCNDGNMDVAVGDLDGGPMILRNHGVPGQHWVSFELAGTKSNRLALNARIKIVAGGMTQTQEIHSGGSYLSQNNLRAHFGLGRADKISSVEIHWPSGKVENLGNLAAEQRNIDIPGQIVFMKQIVVPQNVHDQSGFGKLIQCRGQRPISVPCSSSASRCALYSFRNVSVITAVSTDRARLASSL